MEKPAAMKRFLPILALFILPFCKSPTAIYQAENQPPIIEKDTIFEEIFDHRWETADIDRPKGMIGAGQLLDETRFSVVPVYYATDRKPSGKQDPYLFFTGNPGKDSLYFGKCMVTIPTIHELGEIERPKWWKAEFAENPCKHMVIKELKPLAEEGFYEQLHWDALLADRKEALVFIHGFNVSFDEAALCAAQIAYDVSFQGIPMLYSWPSRGEVTKYRKDGRRNAATVPNLEYFLETLADRGGFDQIHIVAHSMGNQALTQTLMNLAEERPEKPMFGQVILAAPDVDSREFVEVIAPAIRQTASNVTLYASAKDKALLLSQLINKGLRAGTGGEDCVVTPFAETVDASDIDTDFLGHSYFSNTWLLINDLYYLINKGLPADQRFLQVKTKQDWKYWFF